MGVVMDLRPTKLARLSNDTNWNYLSSNQSPSGVHEIVGEEAEAGIFAGK
jgi:hypothetical protein